MPGLDKSHRISVASEEEAPLLQQRVTRSPTAAAAAASCSKQHSKDIDSSGDCEPRTCRICFETEEGPSSSDGSTYEEPSSSSGDNPLISPCLCSGSSRYVHRKCLQQWRTTNHRADAYFQCEVCKFRYQYRRLWWATLLGHRLTILASFLLLVTALTWVTGYIPLVPSAAAEKVPWVLLHILNGVVVMGVLGVVLSIASVICRAAGITTFWCLPDAVVHSCCLCCSECSGPSLLWGDLSMVGAECGLAFLSLLVVMTISVGFLMSCYMLYAILWAVNMQLLERAQLLVENVTPPGPEGHAGNAAPSLSSLPSTAPTPGGGGGGRGSGSCLASSGLSSSASSSLASGLSAAGSNPGGTPRQGLLGGSNGEQQC